MWRKLGRLRPRLLGSILTALILFWLLSDWQTTSRFLISWDAGIVLYLALTAALAARSGTEAIRRRADIEDVGALAILVLTVVAAMASLAAIVIELRDIHSRPGNDQAVQLTIAGMTILCSWFFVHTIWAVHYAHEFYGDDGERRGLKFPHEDEPDYWDFLYFSFNLGAAAQTSDVAVVSRSMRRLVLSHTILAFLFNTMILAVAVNVGASMI